jgi:hypothetical protein
VNTDFSVTKDTKITERLNLQFRIDMFDVFNHENFGNPVLTAASGAFGFIGSTRFPTGDFGSSRQIQFSLFLQFQVAQASAWVFQRQPTRGRRFACPLYV